MKKAILVAAMLLVSASAFSQKKNIIDKALSRFSDPDAPKEAFLAKGGRAIGISGSYRHFGVTGDSAGDGYSILSLLNIGEGKLQTWSVAPSFAYFISDDFSLGVRLSYSGYAVDTNLQLDFRDILGTGAEEENLNVTVSRRHMDHHKVGIGLTGRRYLSFFGSKMLGVFAEGRLYANYGATLSHPISKDGEVKKIRISGGLDIGLKIAGGAAVRLKDNSVLTLSVPIVGAVWQHSRQKKYWTTKDAEAETAFSGATMNRFNISRDMDLLGIQVGYVRYILPKNKRK